jgi:hypothetical protein
MSAENYIRNNPSVLPMEFEIDDLEKYLVREPKEVVYATCHNEDTEVTLFLAEAHIPMVDGRQLLWFVNSHSEEELANFKATLDHHIQKLQGKEVVTTKEDVLGNPFQRIMMMGGGNLNSHKITYEKHNTGQELHQLVIVGQGSSVNVESHPVQAFCLSWASHQVEQMPQEDRGEKPIPMIITEMADLYRQEYEVEETNN